MFRSKNQVIISNGNFTFTPTILKGLGQIMLQENWVTGGIFLIGICIGSIPMGIGAMLGATVGTLTAQFLKFDATNTEKGLYGFSASLNGVALLVFFKPVFLVWAFIVLGAMAAAILQHLFIIKKVSVYTLPFVLVTWLLVFILHRFFPGMALSNFTETMPPKNDFTFAFKGFGQVIFQGSLLSGLLFFGALFLSSPIAALYGLAGSIIAPIFSAHFLAADPEAIYLGLHGYNAVLCAIVFSGTKLNDGMWALTATLIACAVSWLMAKYSLIELTAPFVFSTVITQQVKGICLKKAAPKNKG